MEKLLMLCLLSLSASAVAVELKPLSKAELGSLHQQHSTQNHAQIYWSLSCVPCRHELKELGELAQGQTLPISLINTGEDSAEQIQAFLRQHHLEQQDHWLFADPIPERLRRAIDPQWFGELPRTYLVEKDGQTHAISGGMDMKLLVQWLAEK